jgi:hypothetical protein
LERGDIVQALQVVAAESTGLPDGTSAVQFAGGWVRTHGSRGETVLAPLSEVPMSATRHLNELAAEEAEPVAADVTMGTPKQAWAPQTPAGEASLDAVATMVSLLLLLAMPPIAL